MANDEMNDMTSRQQVFEFPTEEELANPTDLVDIQNRIKDVIMVLSNFKNLREEGRLVLCSHELIRLYRLFI